MAVITWPAWPIDPFWRCSRHAWLEWDYGRETLFWVTDRRRKVDHESKPYTYTARQNKRSKSIMKLLLATRNTVKFCTHSCRCLLLNTRNNFFLGYIETIILQFTSQISFTNGSHWVSEQFTGALVNDTFTCCIMPACWTDIRCAIYFSRTFFVSHFPLAHLMPYFQSCIFFSRIFSVPSVTPAPLFSTADVSDLGEVTGKY